MNSRKVLLSVVMLIALGFGVGFFGYRAKAQSSQLRPVAVSYTQRAVNPKDGKQLALISTFIRGDGSMVQKTGDLTVVWDVAARTETVIDVSTHSYVVAPLLDRRIAKMQFKVADCVAYFHGAGGASSGRAVTCTENSQAFGYPVTKVHIDAGDRVPYSEDVYTIRELGWIPLRRIQYSASGSPINSSEVIELRTGEPSAAEFSTPPGYRASPNFVDFTRGQKQLRNEPMQQPEVEALIAKWNNLVNEARSAGDTRFQLQQSPD